MTGEKIENRDEIEIGEAKVTSKGQITVPGAVRKELGLAAGDKLAFIRVKDGTVTLRSCKRRSILDYARQNPIRLKQPIEDLDAAIEESVLGAMNEQERRVRKQRRR